MAVYNEGSKQTFVAGSDLSASQFLIVKLNASSQVILAAAATDVLLGVNLSKPKTNDSADVFVRSGCGSVKVICGGTVAVNDAVTANASGQAITTVTAGNQILGYAMEAGTVGQLIRVWVSSAKV